jgi:hypothetical protein
MRGRTFTSGVQSPTEVPFVATHNSKPIGDSIEGLREREMAFGVEARVRRVRGGVHARGVNLVRKTGGSMIDSLIALVPIFSSRRIDRRSSAMRGAFRPSRRTPVDLRKCEG